eukprot:1647577-Prymnesium_polylepis.1
MDSRPDVIPPIKGRTFHVRGERPGYSRRHYPVASPGCRSLREPAPTHGRNDHIPTPLPLPAWFGRLESHVTRHTSHASHTTSHTSHGTVFPTRS